MVVTKKDCVSLAKKIEKETGHRSSFLLQHSYYLRFDAVYNGYDWFLKELKHRLRVVGVRGLLTKRYLLIVSLSLLKSTELECFEKMYNINVKDKLIDLDLVIYKLNK